MILLTDPFDFLELQTQAALSTDWTASWVDLDYAAPMFIADSANGNQAMVGSVTIVSQPFTGAQRQLKYISVVNRDTTYPQVVIIDKNSGGVAYNITGQYSLLPGESLQYVDSHGFSVLDAQGQIKFVGATGASGPPGTSGDADNTFIYTQSTPAAVWLINHGLGRYPAVDVVDSSNSEVDGDLQYLDSNHLSITFSAPFSGEAYLN